MAKVYEIIDFQRRETGSKELITKFGGQPDWVAIEDWPVSAGWEIGKVTFIGQIFLKKNMLGNQQDLMVYLFMTQPECFEDSFYDPDIAAWEGGETAVRIQRLDGVQTPISGASGPTVFDENDAQYEYLPVLKEIQDSLTVLISTRLAEHPRSFRETIPRRRAAGSCCCNCIVTFCPSCCALAGVLRCLSLCQKISRKVVF